MATPQMIRIWIIYLTSNLELMGENTLPLKMRTDDPVSDLLDAAWQCRPASVHDVGVTDLELWRIKTPVLQSPYKTKSVVSSASTTPQHADGTRSIVTLEQFLEDIRPSNISDLAERVHHAADITDFFEEDPERKVQAFVLCPGMPLGVAFVRLHWRICTDLMIPKRGSSSKVPSNTLAEPLDPGSSSYFSLS
jgi:hypothetical protein